MVIFIVIIMYLTIGFMLGHKLIDHESDDLVFISLVITMCMLIWPVVLPFVLVMLFSRFLYDKNWL